jgi:hypothetical protein
MTPSASAAKSLPNSPDAEKGVLSSCLQDQSVIADVARSITPAHMYNPVHADMYKVVLDMDSAGQPIDLITFTQYLRDRGQLEKVGGAGYVTEVQSFVPTSAHVATYAEILQQKYVRRQMIQTGLTMQRRAFGAGDEDTQELIEEATSSVERIKRTYQGANGSDLPTIEDGAEQISTKIVLPDDVIKGLLHRGSKMVLGGISKGCKTWTLLELAASVATGSLWMGRFETVKGKVLYINFELQAPFLFKRLQTICDECQVTLDPGAFRAWNLRGYATDIVELAPMLLQGIGSDHYSLIVLDPIYKLLVSAITRRDENSAGDIMVLLNEIERIAVKTGAAVVFGAHYSKGDQSGKEVIDRIGGSGVFARDPDSIFNFTKHEEEDCYTVDATLRNHPPIKSFVVKWQFPLMVAEPLLDPNKLKMPMGRPKIYDEGKLLELIDEPMSATEIVKVARAEKGIPERRVYDMLDALTDSGKLSKQPGKFGKYERR